MREVTKVEDSLIDPNRVGTKIAISVEVAFSRMGPQYTLIAFTPVNCWAIAT